MRPQRHTARACEHRKGGANMWPILIRLGAMSTLDWNDRHLGEVLKYVIGKPEVVQRCKHLVGRASGPVSMAEGETLTHSTRSGVESELK